MVSDGWFIAPPIFSLSAAQKERKRAVHGPKERKTLGRADGPSKTRNVPARAVAQRGWVVIDLAYSCFRCRSLVPCWQPVGLRFMRPFLSEIQIKSNYLLFRYIYSCLVISMRTEILKYGRIRDLRVDNGLTQQQIAELLNVSQNTYSQYEIGIIRYPLEVVIELAKFYNVSIDYLVGLTDESTPYPRK